MNRLEFLPLTPLGFAPDYWINMGAMAITALTGSTLITASGQSPIVQQISPFLVGLTLLFWAGATWWIPLLILLEIWRHMVRRVRIEYRAEYWSLVFPVGMYAACTFDVAELIHVSLLTGLAEWVGYVAFGLWLITLVGLARCLPAQRLI
jgi:tellurite resistance protein TehA-like permease